MKVKRTNLTEELMGFEETDTTLSRKASSPILINYDHIIEKQAQVIESLYRQCTALRQKINRLKSQELFSSENKLTSENNMEKFAQMIENGLLKEIATLLEIPQNQISRNKVMQSIKRLKWERQKKSEPIFIESKKQVRIPVPVEVEKIVYRDKIVVQEKIVQVPVFRQKIIEKFCLKIEEIEMLPSTISKLSSEDPKKQNSSGLQKFDDSFFLGTQSVLKENSNQNARTKQVQSRKNSINMHQKQQIQRPQTKGYQNYGNSKNLRLSDIRSEQDDMNRTCNYQQNPQQKWQFKSRSSKQNGKSPRYSNKNEYRDKNDKKYEYNEQDDYSYSRGNDYHNNERDYRNDKAYYRNSNQHNNRTIVSPKASYQEKYRDDTDKYTFDKNKFLDSSKINPNTNKHIKRRDKYDFHDNRYRER